MREAVRQRVRELISQYLPQYVNEVITKTAVFDYDENRERIILERKNLVDFSKEVVESAYYRGNLHQSFHEDLESVKNAADAKSFLIEYLELHSHGDYKLVFLGNQEEMEADEKEQEFKWLAQVAADFAASMNKPIGTMEFIEAIEEAIQNVEENRQYWNSGEARMERMMEASAYHGSAYGSELFHDDNSFELGRLRNKENELRGILKWLETSCPLLMCKYQERKLADTQ